MNIEEFMEGNEGVGGILNYEQSKWSVKRIGGPDVFFPPSKEKKVIKILKDFPGVSGVEDLTKNKQDLQSGRMIALFNFKGNTRELLNNLRDNVSKFLSVVPPSEVEI